MFAKAFKFAAAAALTVAAIAPAAADARHWHGDRGGWSHHDRGYGGDRGYYGGRGYYADRGYYGRGGGRYYRGCRDKGTGGTIIGAIAGGLLGNEIGNGRYDNRDGTTGAILGAGVGALAGRAIDRDC